MEPLGGHGDLGKNRPASAARGSLAAGRAWTKATGPAQKSSDPKGEKGLEPIFSENSPNNQRPAS